jgi:hypothetical protein
MKQLKRLFGPRSIAATFATGMLLHSALNALAGSCYQVSAAFGGSPSCGPGQRLCSGGYCPSQFGQYYWCCGTNEACWYCAFNNGTTLVSYCCP